MLAGLTSEPSPCALGKNNLNASPHAITFSLLSKWGINAQATADLTCLQPICLGLISDWHRGKKTLNGDYFLILEKNVLLKLGVDVLGWHG